MIICNFTHGFRHGIVARRRCTFHAVGLSLVVETFRRRDAPSALNVIEEVLSFRHATEMIGLSKSITSKLSLSCSIWIVHRRGRSLRAHLCSSGRPCVRLCSLSLLSTKPIFTDSDVGYDDEARREIVLKMFSLCAQVSLLAALSKRCARMIIGNRRNVQLHTFAA